MEPAYLNTTIDNPNALLCEEIDQQPHIVDYTPEGDMEPPYSELLRGIYTKQTRLEGDIKANLQAQQVGMNHTKTAHHTTFLAYIMKL